MNSDLGILPDGVMGNAYPDSCGYNLKSLVQMLNREEFSDVFSLFYLLPSLFESDLDRGFSVISYNINTEFASLDDLETLKKSGIELKLDFVLNHLSVQSPQFQDILLKGDDSEFVDMFIDWNKFWKGYGEMGTEGYIVPEQKYLSLLFMRKPGLPILKIPFPDGTWRFYWNTFYQKVIEPAKGTCENTQYLGQMDLNAESSTVWDFYNDTFKNLRNFGAKIVRLDAFAYLHKKVGMSNFFNEPGTWEYLAKIKDIANQYDIVLLPEIHSRYEEKIHEKLAEKNYPIYDFFFPGLLIDAIESGENAYLLQWIQEINRKGFQTVNMLGCHDGIPLLDVKGLLSEERIEELITLIKHRGGRVKDLFGSDGQKISYYQINATFFSALGEDERKLLLARAIQIFMPGTPMVWYLDLFAGTNNYEAAEKGGHKEINRTNLNVSEIDISLTSPLVRRQLEMLRFRNTYKAFGRGAKLNIKPCEKNQLILCWTKGIFETTLQANLETLEYSITYNESSQPQTFL